MAAAAAQPRDGIGKMALRLGPVPKVEDGFTARGPTPVSVLLAVADINAKRPSCKAGSYR